jgi:hypothetical protein
MFDRFFYRLFEALGWLLCELAFKTDCRGPFAWSYRVGCRRYEKATNAGIRCGELVENPAFRAGSNLPFYVRHRAAACAASRSRRYFSTTIRRYLLTTNRSHDKRVAILAHTRGVSGDDPEGGAGCGVDRGS